MVTQEWEPSQSDEITIWYYSWFLFWDTHTLVLDPASARNFNVKLVLISLKLTLCLSSEQMDAFQPGPSAEQYWSKGWPVVTVGTTLFPHLMGKWALARMCFGQEAVCVVHGAPTTVRSCPKESQCQIHNVRKNVITFPRIRKIIFWRIYKRTSTLLEYTVNIFIGLYMCQLPCQSIVSLAL